MAVAFRFIAGLSLIICCAVAFDFIAMNAALGCRNWNNTHNCVTPAAALRDVLHGR